MKHNTTVIPLTLRRMLGLNKFMFACIKLTFLHSGNGIGSEGAQALAESLKQNTTLTQLNLKGTLEFMNLCSYVCVKMRLIFSTSREQDWLQRSTGSGRDFEAKHNSCPAGSRMY